MGRKLGAVPLWGGGARSPSNTMWPGPRPTCLPSFVLIRLTVWPQYTNVTDRQDRQLTDSIPKSKKITLPKHNSLPLSRATVIKARLLHFFDNVVRSDSRQDHYWAVSASLWPPRDSREETSKAPAYHVADGGLMLVYSYSRLTSVSTQHGGRPTIVFSGDVSSTRQHSIRGTPLKKREENLLEKRIGIAEWGA